jgi:hypothetical protein
VLENDCVLEARRARRTLNEDVFSRTKVIPCEGNARVLGTLLNAGVLTGADDRTHQASLRDALVDAGVGQSAPSTAQAAQGA